MSFDSQADTFDVVICNDCSSDSEYSAIASMHNSGGGVVVFNPTEIEAKSFNMIPNQRRPGTYIAVPTQNFAGVDEAVSEAIALRNAFIMYYSAVIEQPSSMSSFENKTIGDMTMTNNYVANGCGSPGTWSYDKIPDMPYRAACDLHDLCYTTARTKASCDQEFLGDMRSKIDQLVDASAGSAFSKITMRLVLEAQAGIYYYAVSTSKEALNAYCNNTMSSSVDCIGLPGQSSSGGTKISDETFTSYEGGYTFTYGCELWQFPDGNGGYYYMYRNCKQAYIP